jgi:hypothetical protein
MAYRGVPLPALNTLLLAARAGGVNLPQNDHRQRAKACARRVLRRE